MIRFIKNVKKNRMTKRRKKNNDWSKFTTSKTNAEKNASEIS